MSTTTMNESKKKILIVEDDESVRTMLSTRMEKLGFEVARAEDGFEGLDEARRLRPDLIILDLRLPGRPGEEICKAIREDADGEFSRTPILMLTGKASDVDRVIGMVIGANAYVPKPYRLPKLLKEIDRCLNHRVGSSRRAP